MKRFLLLILGLFVAMSGCTVEVSLIDELDCTKNPNQDHCHVVECSQGFHEEEGSCVEDAIPSSFNWVESGIVLDAQDQKNLGSCALFAATSILESYIARTTGELLNISEQHYIMGSDHFSATSGSTLEPILNFFLEHGVILEENFPYSVIDAKAKTESHITDADYFFDFEIGYTILDDLPEDERVPYLKEIIYNHGPIATLIVFYEDFDAYRSGIYINNPDLPEKGGHWITIVGWVDDESITNGGYWIVKNSFGQNWGENGFGKVVYGDNIRINDFHFYYLIDNS